jgi:hypothetical protein
MAFASVMQQASSLGQDGLMVRSREAASRTMELVAILRDGANAPLQDEVESFAPREYAA